MGEVLPRREDGRASLAEPETIGLHTSGRNSGRSHTVVVRFVFHDGAYFVMAGGKSDWFTNALARGTAEAVVSGRAETVGCQQFPDVGLVRALFAGKYGSAVVEDWYSDARIRALKLVPKPRT